MNRKYKVRDRKLQRYFIRIFNALQRSKMKFTIKYIPRSLNMEADKLANKGIQRRGSGRYTSVSWKSRVSQAIVPRQSRQVGFAGEGKSEHQRARHWVTPRSHPAKTRWKRKVPQKRHSPAHGGIKVKRWGHRVRWLNVRAHRSDSDVRGLFRRSYPVSPMAPRNRTW